MGEHTSVIVETSDGVGVLSLDAPPLHILGAGVRAGLAAGLAQLVADRSVKVILLRSTGPDFSAGGDIHEYGRFDPADAPAADALSLADLCLRVEDSPKPVIAVLQGRVLGGGLELALAAHHRLASLHAVLGLPEVKLGLLPGAGGTQRLPRLIGAGPALDMMLTGQSITASRAYSMGLVDRAVEEDLDRAALAFAQEVKARAAPPTRTAERTDGFADPAGYWAALRKHKAATSRLPASHQAAREIVHCVEAAQMLPFAAGLTLEATAFEELRRSEQSAALRYAFFAERRAIRPPEITATPRPVDVIGIVGAGPVGSALAVACAEAGYQVRLVERHVPSLKEGLARIDALLDASVSAGTLGVRARAGVAARIGSGGTLDVLDAADLVLDCMADDFDKKADLLFKLGQITPQGAILATTTTRFDIGALAPKSGRPEAVLGLHPHLPVSRTRLIEVIPGLGTARDVTATGFAVIRRLGRVPVLGADGAGKIGPRLLAAYRQAADYLLEDGANPGEIDAAMREFGFPIGPCQAMDREGLDTMLMARRMLLPAETTEARQVDIADRLVARGWLGQKSGRGYYRYPEDGQVAVECEEVAALIDTAREEKGIAPRVFSTGEIAERCVLAMINEGARLVGEHVARCPADVDVAMVQGLGFPRWEGGPMFMADQLGLAEIADRLDSLAVEAADFWSPAALILRLADDGRSFADLNG